jgi:hypothetical protein
MMRLRTHPLTWIQSKPNVTCYGLCVHPPKRQLRVLVDVPEARHDDEPSSKRIERACAIVHHLRMKGMNVMQNVENRRSGFAKLKLTLQDGC